MTTGGEITSEKNEDLLNPGKNKDEQEVPDTTTETGPEEDNNLPKFNPDEFPRT